MGNPVSGPGGPAVQPRQQQHQQQRERAMGGGGEAGEGAGQGDGDTQGGEGEGGPTDGQIGRQGPGQQRPQPREFDVPRVPRRWIAQQSDAAREELEEAVRSGAGQRRLKKAEEKKQRLEEILKQAGGPPTRELHFEIKAEAERKRKAKRAYEALQTKKEQAERKIESLRQEIRGWDEEQEECRRRESVSERRLEYLAAQQLADALSDERLTRIREAAAAVANGQGRDSIGPIMELIAVMVPPPAEVDLAAGDTDADGESDSNITKLDMEDDPMDGVQERPWPGGEERGEDQVLRVRRELREAKELLSSALRTRQAAIQEAEETQRKRRKHTREEEGRGEQDLREDEETVAPLWPEQVARMHEIQVEICEKQVRRLEDLLEELGAPTVPPTGAAASTTAAGVAVARTCSPPLPEVPGQPTAEGEGGGGREASGGGQISQNWSRDFEGRFTTAEDRDRKKHAKEQVDQARAAVERGVEGLRRTVGANVVIVEQQRLQEQHELEAETVRQVKLQLGEAADEAKVARAQRRTFRNLLATHGEPGSGPAPLATFGPTGNSLEEMQVTMRQSVAGQAEAPLATRWDRHQGRGRRTEGEREQGRRDIHRCRSQSPPGRQPREPAGARGARSKSPRGYW